MTRLVDIAVAHVRRDEALRMLDAAAGDGRHLVALVRWAFDQSQNWSSDGERSERRRAGLVLKQIRGADESDRGATEALQRWASEHGVGDTEVPVSFGEPLAFAAEPVQGTLFTPTYVARPPAAFGDAPFDLVVADVPQRELDPRQREQIRERYAAASGRFSYEAPFVERVLALAAPDGVVALRLRSAVLRREFGRSLVEEVLGPTEVLAVEPLGEHVVVVCRPHGEATGAALVRTFGSEDAARALRGMRSGSSRCLGDVVSHAIGRTSTPGCDDVWEPPARIAEGVPTSTMLRGEDLGDWRLDRTRRVVWPYDADGRRIDPPPQAVIEWLSRFRPALKARRYFGRGLDERGVRWYEFLEHHPVRWRETPTLVVARNGTDPRAAIIRSSVVVAGNALAVTTPDDVTTSFIAGALNSSLGCFWMKQAFHVYDTVEGRAFELTGSGLSEFPLPPELDPHVVEIARRLDRLGRSIVSVDRVIEGEPDRLEERLDTLRTANARLRLEMSYYQEELDWAVYAAYGLHQPYTPRPAGSTSRSFEDDGVPGDPVDESRRHAIETDTAIRFVESTEFKRTWPKVDEDSREAEALLEWLVGRVEEGFARGELPPDRPVPADEIADWLRSRPLDRAVLGRVGTSVEDALLTNSIPFEAARTFSRAGLARLTEIASGKTATFAPEDYAAVAGTVPMESASHHRRRLWSIRGRYNVPTERFIHLAELSEKLDRALFAWAGASENDRRRLAERISESDDSSQLDLERLLDMQAELAASPGASTAEIADRLWSRGWSYREVRLALGVLAQSGGATKVGQSWRLRRSL